MRRPAASSDVCPLSPDLSREGGFSLVETLIALAILVTALLSLSQLFTAAARSMTIARQISIAATLAAQKVEELRVVIGLEHAAHPTENGVEYLDEAGAVIGPDGARAAFTRRWSIYPRPSDPTGARVIDVTVAPGESRDTAAPAARRPDAVRLVTMRMRGAE